MSALPQAASAAGLWSLRRIWPALGDRWQPFVAVAFLGILLGGVSVHAQNLPAPVALDRYEHQAARIFDPRAITNDDSALITASERLLFLMQGVSVAIIVAGIIVRLRKDHDPMEGVASMMLKVAFIATIPFWRTFALETGDVAADVVGYRATSAGGEPSPVMASLWQLAGEWMPAGSPYLDVLETQAGANAPASGHEQEWSLEAWNWARGVGAVTEDQLQVLWQGVSGGLRAAMVHGCCAAMCGVVLVTVFLAYAGEVLRYLLFYGGCALLPIAIAGLGVEALRRQSLRFLLAIATVACWPVGWGLWNIVTKTVLTSALEWIGGMTTAALALPAQTNPAPSVATAAPFLAWGVLIVFVALTAVVCLWSLAGLFLAPIALGRLSAAGSQVIGGWTGFFPAAANTTVNMSAPRIRMPAPESVGRVTVPLAVTTSAEVRTRVSAITPATARVFESRDAYRPATSASESDRGFSRQANSAPDRVPAWFPPPPISRPASGRN